MQRLESRETRSALTDCALDDYIRVRLALIGVDLSVLPVNDESAPADQRRILAAVRRLLRETVPAISDYSLDPQEVPPVLYPSRLPHVRMAEEGGGEEL